MRAPKAPEDIPEERPRLYDLVITAPGYDATLLIDPNLPKGKRDEAILDFVAKHPLKEFTYTLSNTVNPRTGKPYEIKSRQKLSGEDLESIKKQLAKDEKELAGSRVPEWDLPDDILFSPKDGLTHIGEFLDRRYLTSDDRTMLNGIKANGFLTFRKRSLIAYLADALRDPYVYFKAIIVVYPLFWFIRSIIWSIRNFRQREAK